MTPEQLHQSISTTEISEIFSSIQGEGPYLGKKQIFVRFGRCNMHCVYCDELEKMQKGAFETKSSSEILDHIRELDLSEGPHHSVSLTGGEPLMYSNFLESFLPTLKGNGHTTYIETNGTLPGSLLRHLDHIDTIAMDIKLPSSTQDKEYWKEHREFLRIADLKDVFVKVVVSEDTLPWEIEKSVELVQKINYKTPFIFQPVCDISGINLKAMKLIETHFFETASSRLKDVRVIPQMHKVWGIR